MRFAAATAILLFAWTGHALADLYRWVDPETGSVKFSSYPPPWYGDEAKQRHAPKVEVIAPRSTAPAVTSEDMVPARPREGTRAEEKPKPVPAPPERRE